MTPHPDTERLRYEIEAKTEYEPVPNIMFWPNSKVQFLIDNSRSFYYNSQGKHIATFRLKAWE